MLQLPPVAEPIVRLAVGCSGCRLVGFSSAAPAFVEASYGTADAIVAEASLSFLGLGVQPPAASWGSTIRDGVCAICWLLHIWCSRLDWR